MPAHIKTVVLGGELTIPISNGQLQMGVWQGIYLCKYHNHAGDRTIIATLNGESLESIMKRFFLSMALVLFSFNLKAETAKPIEIEVYRSPTCGCCSQWIAHLEQNNFKVKDFVTHDMPAKKDEAGVPQEMASCHTGIVDGYIIEGHVPAVDIKKLLKIKPKVKGISVPGMPVGTPGMEVGDRKDAYDVLSFDKQNKAKVLTSYKGNE